MLKTNRLLLDGSFTDASSIPNSSHHVSSRTMGKANGTFGELLQGVLPGEEHFLVTMPIACFSKCIVEPNPNTRELQIFPKHKSKSLALAKLILKHFNVNFTGNIFLTSELDEGKGLASSSADLVATARAFEKLLNQNINVDLLQTLLKHVEPTDGVMFDGCVAYYHRQVKLLNFLGYLPMISVIAIDEGGEIDTIQYNTVKRVYSIHEMTTYRKLLMQMTLAIEHKDLESIGRIATQSALMNQRHNAKHHLNAIIEIAQHIKALGIVIAHSGTYIGLMLNRFDPDFEIKVGRAVHFLSRLSTNIKIYETIDFNRTDNTSKLQSYYSDSQQIQV